MSSCVDQIVFFQKKLNKYAKLNEADKVLYYIHKLNHLNVTVSHLEETGVGKTVNALRHQAGKVGERARCLVNKWKEMVTAEEEEEEEENEEEVQERVEVSTEFRGQEAEEADDRDDVDEDDRLHIEENDNLDEDDDYEVEAPPPAPSPPPAAANPYPAYDYYQPLNSESDEDGQYNPLTSKSDYQRNLGAPTAEYHPSSEFLTPRDDSSPEYALPSPPPEPSNAKSHKSHSREKEKRSKEKKHKDRDRSGSRERERKDRTHRDKHRERDERSERKEERREEPEVEEQRKSKSRKDRHHQHDQPKPTKNRQPDGSLANGLHTDNHRDKTSRREKETDRPDRAERAERAERTERVETTSQENRKDRHKETSKKDKQKRDHRDHREREVSPGRHRKEKRSKHQATEDEESVNDDTRTEKGKHKEEKRKHKDVSSKKERQRKEEEEEDEEEEEERIRDSRKKEKKKNSAKMDAAEMDSGFGAALMGLDSAVKKKKKKKKKEDRGESCSEDGGQPSTSKAYKRGLTGDGGGLPDSKKPRLLSAPKDRLPSLPSVMDEKPLLPEITPHYKPLPRPPVREEPPDSGLSRMTEEEALNFMFQSKCNRRSKVYSGKVSGLSYVPSLYESCIRVLQENIDALEFTGGVPFDILRPVLERASPKQLLNLEDYNAYLLEDSGVLWEVHCKRDFKKERLEEMETWREMWLRCSEERDRKLRNLTHNLTEKFLTKAEPKRTTKIAYVDGPAKVPRGVARAQAKYGTATASALAAKPGKANEVAARKNAMQNVQNAERAANPRPTAAKKKKVAPLMAKTRQFFKKAFRR